MQKNNIKKDLLIYLTTSLFAKVLGDGLLGYIKIPSFMVLMSSVVFLFFSMINSGKYLLYTKNKWITLISILQLYNFAIKMYVNLVSVSNTKEIVMENGYLLVTFYINYILYSKNYKKSQLGAMLFLLVLLVYQILYPVFRLNIIDLHYRDFFNFLGTIANSVSLIIFKFKVEDNVKDANWNYSYTLGFYTTAFSLVYYFTDSIIIKKNLTFHIDFSHVFIVIFFSGITEMYSSKICFDMDPYIQVTVVTIINFICSLMSDMINGNYLDIFQLLLAISSTLTSLSIIYNDEETIFNK